MKKNGNHHVTVGYDSFIDPGRTEKRVGAAVLLFLVWMTPSCRMEPERADAYGNFEAVEIIVSAESDGILRDFHVGKGDLLEKGYPAGQIDTMSLHFQRLELVAGKEVLRARQRENRAQTAVLQEQIRVAEREYDRLVTLYGQNAATRKQRDDAEGTLRILEQKKEASVVAGQSILAEINVLSARMHTQNDQIRRAAIRNPAEGTVIARYAEAGELVMRGKPLYRLADLREMDLRAYVSGAQLPDIRIGQEVTVRIDHDDLSYRTMKGVVTWIAPEAEFTPRQIQTKKDRVTLVYAVLIRVHNDGSIKIGMPGEVLFEPE